MALRNDEDERIGRYLERLADFEHQGDALLDEQALRAVAAEVGVSQAALDRAAAQARAHRIRGIESLQRRDWEAAVVELRHAVELGPADADAAWLLGDALRERWHASGAAADRAAAGQCYERSLRLRWRPDADRVRRELEGPRRPPENAATPAGDGHRLDGRPRRDLAPKTALGIGLGMLALGIFAVLAIVVRDYRSGRERAAMARAYEATVERGMAAREAEATRTAASDARTPAQLPLTLLVGDAVGLQLDIDVVELASPLGLPPRPRIEARLLWNGQDALAALSLTLELLDADGKVRFAHVSTVLRADDAPLWPGDVLPIRLVPLLPSSRVRYASARLRVVGVERTAVQQASMERLPLRWAIAQPAGIDIAITARDVERTMEGSRRRATRSIAGTFVIENRGEQAISELQLALSLVDDAGRAQDPSHTLTVVPTFLPELRHGERRAFKAFASGTSAHRTAEFVIQSLAVAGEAASSPPPPPSPSSR